MLYDDTGSQQKQQRPFIQHLYDDPRLFTGGHSHIQVLVMERNFQVTYTKHVNPLSFPVKYLAIL